MNIKSLVFAGSALAAVTVSAVQVSDVTARQRWPWNNLVDVEFTVSDAADGEAYCVDLSAQYRGGDAKVSAVTLLSEPVVGAGTHRLTWDFGKDCPNFKADDMQMIVSVYPFSDATPVYLVIDVSGGESATKYPVRYTTVAPVHTAGAADPCKTTEIWMKRVKHGTNVMGGGSSDSYAAHTVTLTEDYYLGIFPLTQAQVARIGQTVSTRKLAYFTNETCNATRPADILQYNSVRDSKYLYPTDKNITQDSILGRLRTRTGMFLDLPTEWQWEYACRAGLSAARYPGAQWRHVGNAFPEGVSTPDRMWTEEYGTSYVDRYDPNPWGFYGMLGNVWEWCANLPATIAKNDVLKDPEGPDGNGSRGRTLRGGSYQWWNSKNAAAFSRLNKDSWNVTDGDSTGYGARLCLTVKGTAADN